MTELADLSTNVAVLLVKFNAMEATNISDHKHIRETLTEHGKQLEKVDSAIRGNARRGLKARMESVEQFLGGMKKLTWILIGAAAVAVLSAVVAVFVNLHVTQNKEQYREETQAKYVTAVDGVRALPADGGHAGLP